MEHHQLPEYRKLASEPIQLHIPTTTNPNSSYPPSPEHSHNARVETFFGFIKDPLDATLLVEACVQGLLKPVTTITGSTCSNIRSGTTIVFLESSADNSRLRFRDGRSWTSSKLSNGFLLYRETESDKVPVDKRNLERREKSTLFSSSNVRNGTRLVVNGLAKRTISLTGSDGNRYRVINYFLSLMCIIIIQLSWAISCLDISKSRSRFWAERVLTRLLKQNAIGVVGDQETSSEELKRFINEVKKYGGTGMVMQVDWFRRNPGWADSPCFLAPLR
ncbi:hypothetical protein BCR33DRAFT_711224 [Rhizoclosmatium globosum]|uniref:Uncharacterized protein n=1 Tax=Rhizoclosmatium globosum TaxID=329046 RepID=A0A1Y2D3U1_9FUNG|nr:hypothetical protein BCR33DRAFT_711224 [Rhizoclosmatium globosum]|eukprot:ORY53887.1 hypothetical protein BCR33DRAFT_711224 [Rhizoclosmatium globosum]